MRHGLSTGLQRRSILPARLIRREIGGLECEQRAVAAEPDGQSASTRQGRGHVVVKAESPEPNPLRRDSAARGRIGRLDRGSPAAHAGRFRPRGRRAGPSAVCSNRQPTTPTRRPLRQTILADARQRVQSAVGPHYRKVINATGIILHTALGRAVLPAKALRQIEAELSGYSLLQADIATGERSKRDGRIEELLQQLTGAEAATVVNNNAAATSIVLNTVARGREVIVSRGQLVEIGGSFRLPDVMAASGAKLVEVGTTNKTHARDYEKAITPNTAAILRVHPSNYKISGFTAEVPLAELVRIGHAHGLVVIDDVGAGPLVDFSRFGFDKEPTLQESVQAGADLITASADKLIGASQGGIILGRADLIQAIRKNPLARIVRVGKLTLAALEATLSLVSRRSRRRCARCPRCGCSAAAWPTSPPRPIASPQAIGERDVRGRRDHGRRVSRRWAAVRCRRRICPPGWSRSRRNPSRRANLPRGSAAHDAAGLRPRPQGPGAARPAHAAGRRGAGAGRGVSSQALQQT